MDEQTHDFYHRVIVPKVGDCRLCVRRRELLALFHARVRDLGVRNVWRWLVAEGMVPSNDGP